MIELRDVFKRYGNADALNGLSLSVAGGEFCVLIGPSGCGKSTTLRLINRLVEPTAGEVVVDGRPVHSFRPEALRRGIGYVIQSVGLLPHMTVEQNIAIVPGLLKWDRSKTARRVEELLSMVGLPPDEYRGKFPSQLSGGEAQRVGVARGLAADPPILLMDEPFGAVDPLTRETLQDEFASIQRELRKTVVFVTHDLDEAVRLADQVVVMRSGKIVQQSSPETLLERPSPGFVQEFVGGDRVLKRLSRFLVGDHMQPGEFRPAAGESRPYVTPHVDHPFTPVWRIDDTERLVGLSIPGSDSLLRPPEPFWVDPEATLREALSLMLYLHVDRLPVAARDRRPAGVVTLARVHAVARRSVGHHE